MVDFLSVAAGILSVLSSGLSLAAEVRRSHSKHEDEQDLDDLHLNGGADSPQA
ncbi:hypothetical protein [Streptomyces sp. NBC_00893]|uniref:hypothetical protein n=1 Tax=Streptomyces sp. NBC_00893 TaxID=2975862 RepID=UPI00225B90E1|nr:hypothetical protein [Streptomyces sp. NBC_00893]MCX4851284.1 hypothetical protein [Streptomyces sp. NBC_00893]